eukprot:COSAG01_NODE_1497_length_10121_cov_74.291359_11_plen_75_part_00
MRGFSISDQAGRATCYTPKWARRYLTCLWCLWYKGQGSSGKGRANGEGGGGAVIVQPEGAEGICDKGPALLWRF